MVLKRLKRPRRMLELKMLCIVWEQLSVLHTKAWDHCGGFVLLRSVKRRHYSM